MLFSFPRDSTQASHCSAMRRTSIVAFGPGRSRKTSCLRRYSPERAPLPFSHRVTSRFPRMRRDRQPDRLSHRNGRSRSVHGPRRHRCSERNCLSPPPVLRFDRKSSTASCCAGKAWRVEQQRQNSCGWVRARQVPGGSGLRSPTTPGAVCAATLTATGGAHRGAHRTAGERAKAEPGSRLTPADRDPRIRPPPSMVSICSIRPTTTMTTNPSSIRSNCCWIRPSSRTTSNCCWSSRRSTRTTTTRYCWSSMRTKKRTLLH